MAIRIVVVAWMCMALGAAGCGSMVAMIDTQEAMEVADKTNVENWAATRAAQLEFLDGELAKLDGAAGGQIAEADDGPAASAVFADYLATRAMLEQKRAAAAEKYSAALDNAVLAAELRARQRQIIAGWYGLIRMLPGVETVRAMAEAKARKYVADFNAAAD